jgi:hypothetical protein
VNDELCDYGRKRPWVLWRHYYYFLRDGLRTAMTIPICEPWVLWRHCFYVLRGGLRTVMTIPYVIRERSDRGFCEDTAFTLYGVDWQPQLFPGWSASGLRTDTGSSRIGRNSIDCSVTVQESWYWHKYLLMCIFTALRVKLKQNEFQKDKSMRTRIIHTAINFPGEMIQSVFVVTSTFQLTCFYRLEDKKTAHS